MKVLGFIGKVLVGIWQLIELLIKVGIIAVVVIVILTILMPENAIKALEILRGLIP
jgi:hypothetical protein